MANLIKIVVVLLFVLPALFIAEADAANTKCSITVSSKLDSSANNRNTNHYEATITNVGTAAAANIKITPSSAVNSLSGLKSSGKAYVLQTSQVNAGGIAAGATATFTYTATKGHTVKWTTSCTDGASEPTSAPTASHTSAPTTESSPTHAPTSAPTTKAPATKAPTTTTKAPATTKAPTAKSPTAAPTSAPSTAVPANGRVCPAGTWWAPAPQTTWQWQLTGTIDTSYDVQMYDIDLFDNTAETIATLHSQGRVVICYFSTQYENWRPDASEFTAAVLGNGLSGWTGENYVDIRSTVVRNIMTARMDLAVTKGCDGLEPDNVDGYENDSGFPLTAADQLNFNEFIATNAHARGLSVGLKNDVDQSKDLEPYFDWALDEQCKQYSECDTLTNFISAGKAVFECEYSGTAANVCPYMVGIKFSSLIKGLDLTASIKAECCTYQTNGCAAVPHQCVTSVVGGKKRSLPAEENQAVEVVNEVFDPQQEAPVAQAAAPVVQAAHSAASTTYSALAVIGAIAVAVLNL